MRQQLTGYLDDVITALLLLVAGITPLLFLNQTTEFYDMPKLTLLVVSTILLFGLWIASWIVKGKIVITRTPLDIPLLIFMGTILVSTYFSTSRYSSIYGNFPTVHGSAVAWVTYILLYFVTVSHLKNLGQIKTFLYVLYGSAVAVAAVSLMSFFHAFLPFDFAKAVNFTPTGSSFSTLSFLLLLLPLPLFSLLKPNKYMPVPLALAVAILFGVTIALIGSLPTYIALLIAVGVCLLVVKPNTMKSEQYLFFVPVALTALVLILAYLPFPGNKIQSLEANFPKEIQLPIDMSWKIAASAFRDAPFLGTGPSTFLFNFTSYKPAEYNVLKFWNFSFETAHDEFLQILGTLGVVGLVAMLLLCLIILNNGRKNLLEEAAEDAHLDNTHVLLPALASSGLMAIVLLAIHTTTLVSVVVSFFMLAALMMSQKSIRDRVMEFSMGIKATTANNRHFDVFPVIIFVVFLIAAVPALYQTFNIVAADYYHRQALASANKSGTATYQFLQKAESLNPRVDLYRVDMAQTNFALANALAAQKRPNNAGLSDQDKKTIQTLLAQALNEGKVAVALSPRSSRNWEVLGAIYKNITGVAQNALAFALDAYGRAIQRDPMNPVLRLNVGGIYYAAKNYDLAIRFFSDAANLKPDYANAYFNLSIALREKGDYQNARLVAQQTVSLLQKDTSTPDYKTAVALLKDLDTKAASSSAAPATQTNSALQNQNANVNVPSLNNPPQPATPSAVKQNPNAKLPQTNTQSPTKTP